MKIEINGKEYEVGLAELKREATIETKYDVKTEDGVKHRELRGIYLEYSLLLGNISKDTYDTLWNALLTYDEYHTVKLPDGKSGYITFEAFFDTISDELIKDNNGVRFWDNLTVKFSAREPLRSGE